MENVILIEKLSGIRDRVDLIRDFIGITELDFVYNDLTEILEELE